jgi:hypothetical protein
MSAQYCHVSQFGEPNPERKERMKERSKQQAEKEEFELGESLHRVQMGPPGSQRQQAAPVQEGQTQPQPNREAIGLRESQASPR